MSNICENCGQENDGKYGSGRFCSEHCRRSWCGKQVKNHVCNFNVHKSNKKEYQRIWVCDVCNKTFLTRSSMYKHKRKDHIHHKRAWNYGLTKETDYRVAKYAKSLNEVRKTKGYISPNKGKSLSDEVKKKISNSCRKYYLANPEKIPYLLYHSSKESYPEKYFKELFLSEGIIGWTQELYVNGYFLDFGFLEQKIDFEIDGSQHTNDKRIIEHDKIRNHNLEQLGWTVLRINWNEWKLKSEHEKKTFINSFKEMLNKLIKHGL